MTTRLPAVAALICLTGLTSGCATTIAGTAMPAGSPGITTSNLAALLLPAADVGAALSAKEMVVTRDVAAPWDDKAHITDGTACLAVAGAAQRGVYADSGWSAVHGQVLREAPTAPLWSHFATQAVVLFKNPRAAGDFLSRSRQTWAACSQRELTYKQQLAPEQVWSVGPVVAEGDVLTVSRQQRGPENWSCQRALTAHGLVAVDVEACTLDGTTTAAATIARAIADRIGPA